jgi:hypothetical protein
MKGVCRFGFYFYLLWLAAWALFAWFVVWGVVRLAAIFNTMEPGQ